MGEHTPRTPEDVGSLGPQQRMERKSEQIDTRISIMYNIYFISSIIRRSRSPRDSRTTKINSVALIRI